MTFISLLYASQEIIQIIRNHQKYNWFLPSGVSIDTGHVIGKFPRIIVFWLG